MMMTYAETLKFYDNLQAIVTVDLVICATYYYDLHIIYY